MVVTDYDFSLHEGLMDMVCERDKLKLRVEIIQKQIEDLNKRYSPSEELDKLSKIDEYRKKTCLQKEVSEKLTYSLSKLKESAKNNSIRINKAILNNENNREALMEKLKKKSDEVKYIESRFDSHIQMETDDLVKEKHEANSIMKNYNEEYQENMKIFEELFKKKEKLLQILNGMQGKIEQQRIVETAEHYITILKKKEQINKLNKEKIELSKKQSQQIAEPVMVMEMEKSAYFSLNLPQSPQAHSTINEINNMSNLNDSNQKSKFILPKFNLKFIETKVSVSPRSNKQSITTTTTTTTTATATASSDDSNSISDLLSLLKTNEKNIQNNSNIKETLIQNDSQSFLINSNSMQTNMPFAFSNTTENSCTTISNQTDFNSFMQPTNTMQVNYPIAYRNSAINSDNVECNIQVNSAQSAIPFTFANPAVFSGTNNNNNNNRVKQNAKFLFKS